VAVLFDLLDPHSETHRAEHAGWLRAAVLGANDGLVSTASLMVGVAAAGAGSGALITAGLAGLSAGAMAMAAGEYVSVSSQADIERGDRAREARELREHPEAELSELAGIYASRGIPAELARQVAEALHARDPLAAHMRDELGHTEVSAARPVQAALASAASFLLGGMIPFLGLLAHGPALRPAAIVVAAVLGLVTAGLFGARTSGGPLVRPTLRVLLGGSAAMAITAVVGQLAHVSGL
jgi:VIT1/CCC1 family predicted Fe2+/Mn2+ transporter